MAAELIGKQAKLTFTPGSSGSDITPAEGVIFTFTRIVNSEDMTELGVDEEDSGDLGYSTRCTLRCKVNTANGNPQIPNGIRGTVVVYKNKNNTSHGSWAFMVRITRVTLSANGRGHQPQFVDYSMVATGGITEVQ